MIRRLAPLGVLLGALALTGCGGSTGQVTTGPGPGIVANNPSFPTMTPPIDPRWQGAANEVKAQVVQPTIPGYSLIRIVVGAGGQDGYRDEERAADGRTLKLTALHFGVNEGLGVPAIKNAQDLGSLQLYGATFKIYGQDGGVFTLWSNNAPDGGVVLYQLAMTHTGKAQISDALAGLRVVPAK